MHLFKNLTFYPLMVTFEFVILASFEAYIVLAATIRHLYITKNIKTGIKNWKAT